MDFKEFTEKDVEYSDKNKTINGTITIPRVISKRLPAVLLIAGSGPTDRDWNSPFLKGENGSGKLLAWELSKKGIVVFRYDKIGSGVNTKIPKSLSWFDFLQEQELAIDFLLSNLFVDPDLIFVAGHSEGCLHAINFAKKTTKKIKGLIMLASPARPMKELLMDQLEDILKKNSVDEKIIKTNLDIFYKNMIITLKEKKCELSGLSNEVGLRQFFKDIFSVQNLELLSELYFFEPMQNLGVVEIPVLFVACGKDAQIKDADIRILIESVKNKLVKRADFLFVASANHVLKTERRVLVSIHPETLINDYNKNGRMLSKKIVSGLISWIKIQIKSCLL